MKRLLSLILIICMVMSLTACSGGDSVEINKREYLFAIGIDVNENKDNEEDSPDFLFTAEVPLVNKGESDESYIIQETAENLTGFYFDTIVSGSKAVNDSLLQVIVLGEDVCRDKDYMKRLFDEIERSPKINRKVRVVVAKGRAEDIIKTKLKSEILVGKFISDLLIKLKKNNLQNVYTFDDALLYITSLGQGSIAVVEPYNEGLKIEGAAAIRDFELVGFLDYRENEIVNVLTGPDAPSIRGVTINLDDSSITLSSQSTKVSRDVKIKNNQIKADIYVTMYCYVSAYRLDDISDTFAGVLDALEKKAVEDLNKETAMVLNLLQKKYKTDLLGIQEHLIKYHKSAYNKIKDNYAEAFANADINVYYDVKVVNTGMVK